MQSKKTIAFYHDKGIDMLKHDGTLPNLANICLYKSTDAKLYPFTEAEKVMLEKTRDYNLNDPPIVFTHETVADETFIRNSTNKCQSIAGIDARQLYPCSMCQPMAVGRSTR